MHAIRIATVSEILKVKFGFKSSCSISEVSVNSKIKKNTTPCDMNLKEWFKIKINEAKEYAQQKSGPENISHFSSKE